jgi:hypothetical protein
MPLDVCCFILAMFFVARQRLDWAAAVVMSHGQDGRSFIHTAVKYKGLHPFRFLFLHAPPSIQPSA